ncbi:alpha-1-inhibitor 3-like isoform X4 [Eriocheir sinensis]|uniref:alpha-1-inhibitor 3-like isoform X4 n=1 Tax=Eriocheir sinensis TaxID=95602 RepID=UPI0021C85C23|nr:alpha-1-inhibitor 3-like isoform X4 [Eriocheir sinensis]
MGRCAAGRLLGPATIAVLAACCLGGYIITTPRKWPSGERVQVCLFSVDGVAVAKEGPAAEEGTPERGVDGRVTVKVKPNFGEEDLVPNQVISLPPGKTEVCQTVAVPQVDSTRGKLEIHGNLGGKAVSHSETLLFATTASKTFVQTDKFLYMPGQKVQFRVLTITGPYLKVFTGVYPAMWIESPAGSRIAQWIDVDASAGLVHQEFQLISEPDEGTYKIHVESPVGGSKEVKSFKVEEFVLPRFEVTVEAPPYILGSDKRLSYKVCATYTYGQPVKGNVTFLLTAKEWGNENTALLREEINGCHVLDIDETVIKLSRNRFQANTFGVTATVTEAGTGQQAKGESTMDVQRTARKFEHVAKEVYVKPNLPFTGEFEVKLPSSLPAAHERVQICHGDTCKNFTTDSRGRVKYVFPAYEEFMIRIKSLDHPRIENPSSSYQPIMFKSDSTHSVKRYYSPSGSGLVIQAPEVQLRCETGESQNISVPVLYAATEGTKANFTIQLVSRGQIQYTHTLEHTFTQSALPINTALLLKPMPPPAEGIVMGVVNLPLTVPLTSSPTAKVLVWYTREDGEVVSDFQEIDLKKCLTNLVSLKWSAARAGPGDTVDLAMTAEPQSLCSLGVVDKSVELLSSKEGASSTLEEVFTVVKLAGVKPNENSQIDNDEYCSKNRPESEPPTPFPRPPFPPGPPGIPRPVPFAAEEPLRLAKRSIWRPGRYLTNHVDAIKMFEESDLFVFTDLKVETRPCTYESLLVRAGYGQLFHASSRQGKAMGMNIARTPNGPKTHQGERPDSLHKESTTTSSSRSYFPETFLWDLNVLRNGTHTQELSLPHTITEWVGKAVCVHPDHGIGESPKASIITFTPFFIDLTLPPSVQRGEILPVKISVFNYLDESLPVKVILGASEQYDILDAANGTRSSCIPSQDKVVHTVRVKPKVVGDMNLTVEAFVDELYPEVCGPEYVISKRDHLIKPIRVELEGFPQEKTWSKFMCTDEASNDPFAASWRLEAPSDIVPDSARGFVTAVGDLLGPTLDNLGSLVRMPYGCGEQNMINFAPNIFVLQYLEAAGKTTSDIAEKAIEFMKSGYQRELRYRHEDGSFSAFGPSDESGSTWLTAFVLKSFAQAQQFIPIDTGDIDMSRDWLKRSQMENGCFLSKGKVFHKGMKGGIAGNDNPVPLSAYILTSLLEAGELTTSRAVSEAAFCLVSDKSNHTYTQALKSYALALAGDPRAATLLTQLLAKATTSADGLYWELPSSDGKSDAPNVEAAAYVLLAMATLSPTDYVNEMQQLVKWISSKRNGQGGFVSTQDTVVALQALAKYEMVLTGGPVNVAVLASFNEQEHTFSINEDNKLLLQRTELTSFPTTVTADVAGEGCALVQAVLRYNIPAEAPSTAFTLRTTTETAPDDECKTKKIKVCASYTLPDLKSNMAVIEVNLISGYIPSKDDLKQVVGYGTGLIKRYEVDGRKVTFYIDEFSPKELCVAFRATREVDVEDAKPGTVRVYDYYDPEQFVSESYTFPPNDECVSSLEAAAAIEGLIIEDVMDYLVN